MTEPVPETAESAELDNVADDDEAVLDMAAMRRLRNEAKRLRHLLREEQENRASEAAKHQADRESDLARLAAMERREVERAASDVLADPSDLWLHTDEATQQEWVDQQFGEVIPDAVRDAARALTESKPHLARRDITPPPTQQPVEGLRPGASPAPVKPPAATWETALRGR